jgi:HK97 family phage portal protein
MTAMTVTNADGSAATGGAIVALTGSAMGFEARDASPPGDERRSMAGLGSLFPGWLGGLSLEGNLAGEDTRPQTLPAFQACVRVVSDAVARLDAPVIEMLPGDVRVPAPDHPAHRIMHLRPNPETTAYTLRKCLIGDRITDGNGYAYLARGPGGRLASWWYVRASRVRPFRRTDRSLAYDVCADPDDGSPLADGGTVDHGDMVHVKGPSYNGVTGVNVIKDHAARTLGVAMAAQIFGLRFFENDARGGVALESPEDLDEQGELQLVASYLRAVGSKRRGMPFVLSGGVKANSFAVAPQDAAYLEVQRFGVLDVCRLIGVPPHMVAELDNAKFSNVENMGIEFVEQTIAPIVTELVQELNVKAFARAERGRYAVRIDTRQLERADSKTRGELYKNLGQVHAIGPDEVRQLEGLAPKGGVHAQTLGPANMAFTESLNLMLAAQAVKLGVTPPATPADANPDDTGSVPSEEPGVEPGVVDERALGPGVDPGVRDAVTRQVEEVVGAVLAREAKAAKERRSSRKTGDATPGGMAAWWRSWYPDHRSASVVKLTRALHVAGALVGRGEAEARALAEAWMVGRAGEDGYAAAEGVDAQAVAVGLVGTVMGASGEGGEVVRS